LKICVNPEILPGKTPMRAILDLGAVWQGFTAVHCTHTSPADMQDFVAAGGNVLVCPLTEGNLGETHPSFTPVSPQFHPGFTPIQPHLGDGIADLSHCGGRISVGSDCNARIDMLEELRWLEYAQRLEHIQRGAAGTLPRVVSHWCFWARAEFSVVCFAIAGIFSTIDREGHTASSSVAQDLFDCATTSGARSLGLPTGQLQAGMHADMAVIDLDAKALAGWQPETLMESLIFGCGGGQVVAATCVGGEWWPAA